MMTRPDTNKDEAWLDAELEALRDTRLPSDDFLARMTADAIAAQPQPHLAPTPLPWWRQTLDAFGGWGGLSGLAAATVVGFAIGLGGPVQVETTISDLLGVQGVSEDALLALDWASLEG